MVPEATMRETKGRVKSNGKGLSDKSVWTKFTSPCMRYIWAQVFDVRCRGKPTTIGRFLSWSLFQPFAVPTQGAELLRESRGDRQKAEAWPGALGTGGGCGRLGARSRRLRCIPDLPSQHTTPFEEWA